MSAVQVACPTCEGQGHVIPELTLTGGRDPETCRDCWGSGWAPMCLTCGDSGVVLHRRWGARDCPEPTEPCPDCASEVA